MEVIPIHCAEYAFTLVSIHGLLLRISLYTRDLRCYYRLYIHVPAHSAEIINSSGENPSLLRRPSANVCGKPA